jgi:hypothetical protein
MRSHLAFERIWLDFTLALLDTARDRAQPILRKAFDLLGLKRN